MTDFTFTSPNGGKYTVTGPDGATAQQAFGILQQHLGAQPITVNAPDGSRVNFPAGTDAATINAVMHQHFGGGAPQFTPVDHDPWAAMDRQPWTGWKSDPQQGGGPSAAGNGNDVTNAYTGGAIEGVPIAGPAIKAGSQKAAAAIRSIMYGTPYADELKAVQGYAGQQEVNHPIAHTLGEVTGALGSTGALARTAAGARLLGLGAEGLGGQVGMGALSGGGIGGLDAAARGNDPITGAFTGAALGGAIPGLVAGASAVASPLISNLRAAANPQSYATRQVARALMESGQSPADIDAALRAANAEGQGQFTVADAMGNAGQRMLSTVARAPGQGRTDVANFLESRQAGQGRRIASALAEGFDSPQTAAQTEARLTAGRDATADTEFDAARNNADPVDLTGTVAQIDKTLAPGLSQIARPSGLANDSIENALQGIRDRLTDGQSMLTDFTAVQRVRGDLSDQVQAAVRAGQGNRARLLNGVLRQMDSAMEDASPGFLQANKNFAQASRNIEAVGQGQAAALRGRTEDILPEFQNLTPEGQQAYRAGYADPLIAQAQGAAFGANKARPLINDAFNAESNAMAPAAARMQRQIAREQTMFETRAQALGGSRTADNLADQEAMGIDPSIIRDVVFGNHHGALRGMLNAASNGLTGNTAAVRQQVGRILLSRGDMPPGQLQNILGETMQRIANVRRQAATIGRGVAITGAMTTTPRAPASPLYAQ
jgi:hypothetical protein